MNHRQAAALFADARAGARLDGLPEELRPRGLADAEAIQSATLERLGSPVAGWKIGRHGDHIFSAPVPVQAVVPSDAGAWIGLPSRSKIELEVALRFRTSAPTASLRVSDLPELTGRVTLFEFVRSRFDEAALTTPLDRIADCLSNHLVVLGGEASPWTLDQIDRAPRAHLLRDDVIIAEHEGAHSAAPLLPVLEAWIERCRRERPEIPAGAFVTLGSLTGVLPVRVGRTAYRGEMAGLGPVICNTILEPDA